MRQELDRLTPEERRQLTAYLYTRDHMPDPGFRTALTQKIDDRIPGRWVSLEDAERLVQERE